VSDEPNRPIANHNGGDRAIKLNNVRSCSSHKMEICGGQPRKFLFLVTLKLALSKGSAGLSSSIQNSCRKSD
jgi:hypothetical protein